MILLRLFFEFFKIGLFSVGGGMATLPFLYDMADKTGWFDYAQIADLFQWKAVALAALLLVLTRYIKKTKGLHPVYFIVFSAVIGILFGFAGV